MGASVFRIRIDLIFRRCGNLVTSWGRSAENQRRLFTSAATSSAGAEFGLNVTMVTRYQPGPNKNRGVADLVMRTARSMFRRRFLPGGRFTVATPYDSSGCEGI